MYVTAKKLTIDGKTSQYMATAKDGNRTFFGFGNTSYEAIGDAMETAAISIGETSFLIYAPKEK